MAVSTARAAGALLGLAIALLGGCASSPPPLPPGVADVRGAWTGTWDGGAVGHGTIEMVLKQEGTRVAGELTLAGVPALSATDGPLDGSVQANRFSFQQHAGVVEADLEVRGDEMVGYASGRLRMALRLQRQR
jgi:hypothetical protein